MADNHIPRIPSITDREFPRVSATLYMYCDSTEVDKGHTLNGKEFYIPLFVQEEDDFIGLSIDAFGEQLMREKPAQMEQYLRVQQLLSMLKRFFDGTMAGRKQKMYKKLKVNISGSGIAFPSDVAYHSGQLLFIALFFPQYPFTYLNLLAEVIRSEKAEIGYDIRAQFKDTSDKAREVIAKFVQECQKKT